MSDPQNNNIHQLLQSITTYINEDFSDFTPLQSLSRSLNTQPSYIFLPLLAVLIVLSLFSSSFAHVMITLFSMLYPAYMSFKAIANNNQELCKKWLSYWVVFAFFTIFDGVISTFLFFLPGYYVWKIGFFLWLFYPRTDGIATVYEKGIRPYLSQIRGGIKGLQGNDGVKETLK